MASGFTLGGMAEGISSGREAQRRQKALGLKEQELEQRGEFNRRKIGIQEKRLGLEEREMEQRRKRALVEAADGRIANTLDIVNQTIKNGLEAGKSREEIGRAVQPLVQDAVGIAERIGRDPAMIANQVQATLSAPTPGEAATAEGRAVAAKRTAEAGALEESGIPGDVARATAGIAAGDTKLPDIINMMSSDGEHVISIDRTAPDATGKIRGLANQGYFKVSTGIQAPSREGLTPDAPKGTVGDIIDAQTSARTAVDEVNRLREQVGEGAITAQFTGAVLRGLANVAGEMRQFARASGFDDAPLLDPASYDLSSFGPDAASSQAFRSNTINLAYLLARAAEPGGRLSEPDIQRQVNRLSANAGDQGQFLAALNEVERSTKIGYRNFHESASQFIENMPEIPETLRLPEPTEEEKADQPKAQERVGRGSEAPLAQSRKAADHSVGTRATIDGNTFVVREVDGKKVWAPESGETQ